MSIQKEIVLRYRASGHVRFQIPECLCHVSVANVLENRLLLIDGVERVRLFSKDRKLSIRYDEAILPFIQLARQLFKLIESVEQDGLLKQKSALDLHLGSKWRSRLLNKVKSLKVTHWAKNQYTAAQETVQAAKIVTKIGLKRPKAFVKDPEQAVINFLNDILVFYLIKIHWRRITQEWIPSPLKYRYEWLAVWYLFFLLMRSRKPK